MPTPGDRSRPRSVSPALPSSRAPLAGLWLLLAAALAGASGPLRADVAVSANDNKLIQIDGTNTVVHAPAPDTVTVIDLAAFPPRVLAEVPGVPNSVIGPPLSVAVTPDEHYALVTACMKIDPANPTQQTWDDRLTVVDLKAAPPRVVQTVATGLGPSGVSVNRLGTLALVSNRGDGTVSVFRFAGGTLTPAGSVTVGTAASALGHVAIAPDSRRALVTRDGDNLVTVLAIDGDRVALAGRDIRTGLRPYGVDITPDGCLAVVGNVGYGNGDVDTVSLIDLADGLPHAIDSIPVGMTPEGIKLSPDGSLCAVVVQDGSNKPKSSPFHADHGRVVLLRIAGKRFVRVADAPVGHWSQGAAFSADGRTLLVGNMVERTIQVFRIEGARAEGGGDGARATPPASEAGIRLVESQPIRVGGGSAALGTAAR